MVSRLPYPQDHATHIPFLVGLGAYYPIRTVVEFGSGLYSTPLFLNRKAFPKIEGVISEEPDRLWRDKVREACPLEEGGRLALFLEIGVGLNVGAYDLVFIDNGPEQRKIETIRKQAEDSAARAIVVVHDAEHVPYRTEIDKFQTKFVSEKFNPGTAICTNGNYGEAFASNFYHIERVIQDKMFRISVEDVNAWIEVFNG